MRSKFVMYLAVAILIVVAIGCVGGSDEKKDALAKCLASKGAKMYGAEWCPHCKNQKNEFGESFKYVDYVECTQRADECKAAGIEGYPTWIIDGLKYPGEQDLNTLAKISGCAY